MTTFERSEEPHENARKNGWMNDEEIDQIVVVFDRQNIDNPSQETHFWRCLT